MSQRYNPQNPTIHAALVTAENQLFALSSVFEMNAEKHEHLRRSIRDAFRPFIDEGILFEVSNLRKLKREMVDQFQICVTSQNPDWPVCRSRIFAILGVGGLEDSFRL